MKDLQSVKDKFLGKKIVNYEVKQEGCDYTHLFYLDDKTIIEFSHEAYEGDVDVVEGEAQ